MNTSLPVGGRNELEPPSLHWAIVLVLSIVTLGLFQYFWMFRQARFAHKIDPTNKATLQIAVSFLLLLFSFLLNAVVALTVARGGQSTDLGSVGTMLWLFQVLMIVTAYMQIRATLAKHYGLRLNALLTVIFNVYYTQYHLSKIATRTAQPSDAILPASQARGAGA